MRKLFSTLRFRAVAYRLQILIGGGALLLLILIGTVYAILNPKQPDEIIDTSTTIPYVVLTNSYEDGTHTLSGTIELKNRCQRLDAFAMLDDSVAPAIIRLDLTSDDDQGICLEIPETREFSVEVEGPEEAEVQTFINGIPSSGDAI